MESLLQDFVISYFTHMFPWMNDDDDDDDDDDDYDELFLWYG